MSATARKRSETLPEGLLDPNEILVGIALEIEQGGEIAVVDAHLRLFGDDRLGVEGDTEAGGTDHVEIVGAVADGQCCRWVKTLFGADGVEAIELGLFAQDRVGDGAGQAVAVEFEDIGAGLVEADTLGDVIGKEGEAARDQ